MFDRASFECELLARLIHAEFAVLEGTGKVASFDRLGDKAKANYRHIANRIIVVFAASATASSQKETDETV